jgi:hypothetical protein
LPRSRFAGAGFWGANPALPPDPKTDRKRNRKMKSTHLLVVRLKSSNRMMLKIECESKAFADAAAMSILRTNLDRCICQIIPRGQKQTQKK